MTVQRVLTGITTSGTPHLGNYAGAIRPAIAASQRAGVESFYFLADYHALIKTTDPLRVQRSTLEIAATWLAAGLDTVCLSVDDLDGPDGAGSDAGHQVRPVERAIASVVAARTQSGRPFRIGIETALHQARERGLAHAGRPPEDH